MMSNIHLSAWDNGPSLFLANNRQYNGLYASRLSCSISVDMKVGRGFRELIAVMSLD